MCTAHRELFAALAAPFAASEVKSRSQAGRQMRYVTARTIMNRLDAVLGPENWWDHYQPLDKSVVCFLTIRLPDGQLLTKEDVGEKGGDACDEDKDGFSDALKRTAVKFGPGRYLYNDGVANLVDAPVPPPVPPPPARAGSEDCQGRGGKLVYGQSAVPAWPPGRTPKTGEDLHHYAVSNAIDSNLYNWVANTFNPQGFPAKLVDWSPAEVLRALPSIREHLLTVKQRKAG